MFKRVPLVQSYGPSSAVPLTAKFRPIDTRKNEAKWATQRKNSFVVCTVTNRRGVVYGAILAGWLGNAEVAWFLAIEALKCVSR